MKNIIQGFKALAGLSEKELYDKRMPICKACDKFNKAIYVCNNCGCFLPAKTRVQTEACPEGKW